jgi:type IV pilus assembly protein PilC
MKIYGVTTQHPRTGKIKKWLIPAYNREEVDSFISVGVPQKILSIGVIPQKRADQMVKSYSKRFSLEDQVVFFEGMSPLMQVGFNPVKAFLLQARATAKLGVRIITMSIVHGLLSGELLHAAFARHKNVLDDTTLALIEEGESTGTLGETFSELVRVLSKRLDYRRQLQSALTYPCIVIVMACVVGYIFTAVLIPKIKTIYDNLGGQLPGITKFVVAISDFLQSYPILLIAPIVLVIIWANYIKWLSYQMWYCRAMLTIPMINEFLRKSAITNGCRTLAVLLGAGIPMAKALTIAGRSTGTVYFERVFAQICDMINKGDSMTIAFQSHGDQFGGMGDRLAAAVESGEASGEIEEVLNRLSKTFEREMEVVIDRLQQTIVPAVTIVLAVFVGVIVFAIFLPLFGIGQVLMHSAGH